MRKITEFGRRPDVAAVSDYSLIEDYLFEENLASWHVQFASNEIVLAYSEDSVYSGEITENNWYKILGRSDVKFAFGDPNADPGGYRSMMVIQLAEEFYDNSEIFDDLIATNTAMTAPESENGLYVLKAVPLGELNPNSDKVEVGSMEMAVIPALESGKVDYMFNYLSIAKQHDFDFVKLPDEINLSKVKYEDFYETVKIELSDGTVKSGKPIVYGITILNGADHEGAAIEFLKYLFSDEARSILEDMGQPPLEPPVASSEENLPESLQGLVKDG